MQSFGDFFDDWVFFKWQLTNHSPNLIIKTHIHPVNVGQIPPAPTALWQKMGQRHNKNGNCGQTIRHNTRLLTMTKWWQPQTIFNLLGKHKQAKRILVFTTAKKKHKTICFLSETPLSYKYTHFCGASTKMDNNRKLKKTIRCTHWRTSTQPNAGTMQI